MYPEDSVIQPLNSKAQEKKNKIQGNALYLERRSNSQILGAKGLWNHCMTALTTTGAVDYIRYNNSLQWIDHYPVDKC